MNYQEIIQVIKDNSQDGIEALFNQYADSFYGYAVDRWYFSEDEAWEIVYATLDKLIERLPAGNFASQSQFNSYVFKVFKSHLSKRYHKKKRSQQKMNVISIEEATEGYIHNSSLESVGLNEGLLQRYFSDADTPEIKKLKTVLSELTELEKELLLLKAENYSYKEIAQMLNIEDNQLKVKHYRAKKKLITKMKKLQTV